MTSPKSQKKIMWNGDFMFEYLYGMRLRPAGPGCQPMNGLLRIAPGGGRYHSLLIYDRKLTDEELEDYELDFINGVDK